MVHCWDHFDSPRDRCFEIRMMLYVMRLEIYCRLSVPEIGIVACSRRTDVASGKEVTVSHPNDERFHWLKSH